MQRSAIFSPCRSYRYTLTREWGDGPTLVVIMLNPSTADELLDDPTVAGMIKRAQAWGYGRLVVLNLFAWRSTDPRALKTVSYPVGLSNDARIVTEAAKAAMVICAWGSASPLVPERAEHVKTTLIENGIKLHYLKMGKTGQPWHPLYLRHDLKPTEWETR